MLRGLQILKFDLTVVLLALDWLWLQSTTPSQDLRSQNRWLVQYGTNEVQLWVSKNSQPLVSSRLKRQPASGLSPTPLPSWKFSTLLVESVLLPAYQWMVGDIKVHWTISLSGEKPNVESLLSHQGSTRPSSPPTENTVAQVRSF